VLKDAKSSLLSNIYKSVCENEKYDLIKKRYAKIFFCMSMCNSYVLDDEYVVCKSIVYSSYNDEKKNDQNIRIKISWHEIVNNSIFLPIEITLS